MSTAAVIETGYIAAAPVRPSRRRTAPTAPVARPTASGPRAARPTETRFTGCASVAPRSCRVDVVEAGWHLTTRGMAVAMALVAAVMGTALVTCLVAFLSVSNAPL